MVSYGVNVYCVKCKFLAVLMSCLRQHVGSSAFREAKTNGQDKQLTIKVSLLRPRLGHGKKWFYACCDKRNETYLVGIKLVRKRNADDDDQLKVFLHFVPASRMQTPGKCVNTSRARSLVPRSLSFYFESIFPVTFIAATGKSLH